MLCSHEPNKAFLVPDSCRSTEVYFYMKRYLLSYTHCISKAKNLYMVTLADSFMQSKNSDTKTIAVHAQ